MAEDSGSGDDSGSENDSGSKNDRGTKPVSGEKKCPEGFKWDDETQSCVEITKGFEAKAVLDRDKPKTDTSPKGRSFEKSGQRIRGKDSPEAIEERKRDEEKRKREIESGKMIAGGIAVSRAEMEQIKRKEGELSFKRDEETGKLIFEDVKAERKKKLEEAFTEEEQPTPEEEFTAELEPEGVEIPEGFTRETTFTEAKEEFNMTRQEFANTKRALFKGEHPTQKKILDVLGIAGSVGAAGVVAAEVGGVALAQNVLARFKAVKNIEKIAKVKKAKIVSERVKAGADLKTWGKRLFKIAIGGGALESITGGKLSALQSSIARQRSISDETIKGFKAGDLTAEEFFNEMDIIEADTLDFEQQSQKAGIFSIRYRLGKKIDIETEVRETLKRIENIRTNGENLLTTGQIDLTPEEIQMKALEDLNI